MTDNYELVGSIRRNLADVTAFYDEALDPVKRTIGSRLTGTPEAPLPVSDHVLSVRDEIRRDLTYWARFLLDEVKDINGNLLKSGPRSPEVPDLIEFISRWAEWLVGQMPDDAENLETESHEHASKLRAIIFPVAREWVFIGQCPLTVARDGESVECETRLKAVPGVQFIECAGCGHSDTVDWWRAQLVGHRPALVTAMDLVDFLLVDMKVSVEPATVRQWFLRGQVERHGKDSSGRWLYDWAKVEADLAAPRKKSA